MMVDPEMLQPRRLRRSRQTGFRLPESAIVVTRPSRWGNPFKVGETISLAPEPGTNFGLEVTIDPALAVALYEAWITEPEQAELLAQVRFELAGHDLACWCPLDGPCHADVLLRLASELRPEDLPHEFVGRHGICKFCRRADRHVLHNKVER